MAGSFVNYEKPLLTVMLPFHEPEPTIETIEKALLDGAEGFGLQAEALNGEYQNQETWEQLFAAMKGRPVYVTNYRGNQNSGKTDDELAEELLLLADSGATLCDVMGDLFCRHPEEMTDDPQAIEKQMHLIEELHKRGAEVLMSSHVLKFTPAERVLEIALEQQRRGADIVKIVTGAENMEQQIENLRITHLLKQNLQVPFLYLSGGECKILRRIGPDLGCCMYLCVQEHNEWTTKAQPLLKAVKAIRESME